LRWLAFSKVVRKLIGWRYAGNVLIRRCLFIVRQTMNSNNYHAQANVFTEILKKYTSNAKKSKYFAQ